jgi:transposase
MRVTTAFKRLLRLPGAAVADVSFGAEGVIVTVRLRRRRRVCAGCGQTGRQLQIHGRRVKRWRHLDLGASRCVIECELRLLRCWSAGRMAVGASQGASSIPTVELATCKTLEQAPISAANSTGRDRARTGHTTIAVARPYLSNTSNARPIRSRARPPRSTARSVRASRPPSGRRRSPNVCP